MKKLLSIVALSFFLIEGYAQRTSTVRKIVNDSVSLRLKTSDSSQLLAKRDTAKFANGIRNSFTANSSLSYVYVVGTTSSIIPVGTTTTTSSDFMSISIPSAGTWLLDWSVIGGNVLVNTGLSSVLTDNSNSVISDPVISMHNSASTLIYAAGHGRWFLVVASPTIYKIRVFSTNAASGGIAISSATIGKSWVSALKVQ